MLPPWEIFSEALNLRLLLIQMENINKRIVSFLLEKGLIPRVQAEELFSSGQTLEISANGNLLGTISDA